MTIKPPHRSGEGYPPWTEEHVAAYEAVSCCSIKTTRVGFEKFSVLGAVAKPGSYPFVAGTTALQAITLAGGLSAIARGDSVVLTRRLNGSLKRFSVPVESITEGEAEDIPIEPGDILFVPERIF